MATALQTLTQKLANRFEITDGSDLMATLKNTAFKGNVNDSQMTALLIVANQYGLNPWTKEIYAFPDRNNGIVPIVGVDGWARILNENPQFDGIEFDLDDEKCTCRIYRKDRSRPISVTEYMSECFRDIQGPWKTHPKRMLRHKAMIQCARLAFGFTGIYDQDEADRIIENQKEPINVTPKPNVIEGQAVELATSEQIATLNQLIQLTNTDTEKAFAYYSVQSIEQLSKAKAEHFIKTLNGRLDESAQNADNKTSEEIPL
ncbi:phage recombination protein Bet [Avibacterium gallinarum]|uniref:Phage recombination protein Bet n=1 Tax=Avibacterium gallinarum TaxID=755 RepID=A0A379B005_AVIGA|nr:phage recombination protein Bet [Avibacterium gallinarum]POY44062.1 phage recombination protein Bet [Avibacterium gallinarum]TDP29136.1 phage recombination protein Bet [Avibacterium gallinarum]SUB28433.1 phage recombination protein Bet [Avibacterium gallinarum]